MEIKINVTDVQYKALAYISVDPIEWVQNATEVRANAAIIEIYNKELELALADPSTKTISTDREAVVLASTLPSAAERQAEVLAQTEASLPE